MGSSWACFKQQAATAAVTPRFLQRLLKFAMLKAVSLAVCAGATHSNLWRVSHLGLASGWQQVGSGPAADWQQVGTGLVERVGSGWQHARHARAMRMPACSSPWSGKSIWLRGSVGFQTQSASPCLPPCLQWLAWTVVMGQAWMFVKLASLRGDALLSSPRATPGQHLRILALLGGILAQVGRPGRRPSCRTVPRLVPSRPSRREQSSSSSTSSECSDRVAAAGNVA